MNYDHLSVVIDLGFDTTRVGYSGTDRPTQIWDSSVGIPLNLKDLIEEEIYKKCFCTKEEFYHFNLRYPMTYWSPVENIQRQPCLYFDNDKSFDIDESVLERILCMNVLGDRYIQRILTKRIKEKIGNKLNQQSVLKNEEFIETTEQGENSLNYIGTNDTGMEETNKNDTLSKNQINTEHISKESTEPNNENNCTETIKVVEDIAEEYLDFTYIDNAILDSNYIKQMINQYINVGCGLNEEKIDQFVYLFSIPNKFNVKIKNKIAEILFEKYNVPALYCSPKSVLTGFAHNAKICSVIDVGSTFTDFSFCNEGIIDENNYNIFSIGGNTIDYFLEHLFKTYTNETCTPYYERLFPPQSGTYDPTSIHSSFLEHSKLLKLRELKETCCMVAGKDHKIEEAKNFIFNENIDVYLLPDGENITISKFKYIAPEIFFTPSILKIANMEENIQNLIVNNKNFEGIQINLFNMFKQVKKETYRQKLMNTIILTGSTTLFRNWSERFQKEFTNICNTQESIQRNNFQVVPQKRNQKKYASWLGGSIISSFKRFDTFFVTKTEYEEYGFDIIHRKC